MTCRGKRSISFTQQSADTGLLDIFSINDGVQVLDASNPPNVIGMAPPTVRAGVLNLNSTQAVDLQAMLAGTILNELDSTDFVAQIGAGVTAAPVLAGNIVSATSATPMLNTSELVTRSGLATAILPLPAAGVAAHDQRVKTRREVVARALSTVPQTRTWNLLIDVISHVFPPTPPQAQTQQTPLPTLWLKGNNITGCTWPLTDLPGR